MNISLLPENDRNQYGSVPLPRLLNNDIRAARTTHRDLTENNLQTLETDIFDGLTSLTHL